jgi:hypothetical protein
VGAEASGLRTTPPNVLLCPPPAPLPGLGVHVLDGLPRPSLALLIVWQRLSPFHRVRAPPRRWVGSHRGKFFHSFWPSLANECPQHGHPLNRTGTLHLAHLGMTSGTVTLTSHLRQRLRDSTVGVVDRGLACRAFTVMSLHVCTVLVVQRRTATNRTHSRSSCPLMAAPAPDNK